MNDETEYETAIKGIQIFKLPYSNVCPDFPLLRALLEELDDRNSVAVNLLPKRA